MAESGAFKVPSVDEKLLTKLRKPVLPASVPKVNIPPPTTAEPQSVEQFEQNTVEIPPVPYKEPRWSRKCDPAQEYSFEVEKNGVIIEEIKQLQHKPFWLFGRLPNCDVNMAHPTISRYHAILQYRGTDSTAAAKKDQEEEMEESNRPAHASIEPGWYLYDLNSTHGTFLNKQQIPVRTYVRVRVGYMIKLGSSSRTYIFQGPSEDDEESSRNVTITEMKVRRQKQVELREEIDEITRKEQERVEKLKEEQGITWGMAEDADEETDLTENPYASSNNEELFLNDPKKTLRGYFEREGHELDYNVEELSAGTYRCKVELPIDGPDGQPLVAEATHKGKKKEAVIQCAMEACRILDRYGKLRQANHEPRRRFRKQSDSDDDDDFMDRTGAVEERRERKQAAMNPQTHTFADLIHKEALILDCLEANECKIQNARLIKQETHLPENDDDVEKFLSNLAKDTTVDKFEIRRLRQKQVKLNSELKKIKKLIEVTKPVDLDKIGMNKPSTSDTKRQMLPLFGKRTKLSNTFGIRESSIKAEKDADLDPPPAEPASSIVPVLEKSPKQPQDDNVASSNDTINRLKQEKLGEPSSSKHNLGKRSLAASAEPKVVSEAAGAGGHGDSTSIADSKKKRTRLRGQKTRENVDIDDTVEMASEDKNVEWVPPSGQTGDGRTSLNEKYGY
ncbi:kanadaptin [Anopheles maculipalpis]|uniref:kanadaptin n=1 Tax=Anopheles maculipalpis TaxID=1496333 RepID=UPI002158A5EB|nr:kanadaptin [Anopheles maculipalpis]